MLQPRRPYIAKDLGRVLVGQRFTGFQFHDDLIFNQQVRKIIPQKRPVLIIDSQRDLLLNLYPQLAEAIGQAIFIDLFQMAVLQIYVQIK